MSKKDAILVEARKLAETAKTWADLSNAFFAPMEGLVTKFFPDMSERKAFRKTETYDMLHTLVEQKVRQTGFVEGATPRKSGKFVVRLPRSLHAALEREAAAENTSLNQLALAKLAIQLDSALEGPTPALLRAFAEVREGYSADRVVADPQLDKRFLRRCRELGLAETDYGLNWALLNARKNGSMSLLPKTKRYTVKGPDEFDFASELAARYLQLTKGVSLDMIICDPELAQEFDDYAHRLAPGRTPLEYRWVALGLRKADRLRKDAPDMVQIPQLEPVSRVSRLDPSTLPESCGLYLFTSAKKPVFLSQTDNLRHRIQKHFRFSDARGLPKWLWEDRPLDLRIAEMPGVSRAKRQQAEILLVRDLHPTMNLPRRAA